MKRDEMKAVIFDMNGVLALGVELKEGSMSKSFHLMMSKSLKIGVDTWMDAIDSVYVASIEGKISEKKLTNTIAKNLKISQEKLEKLMIKNYKKIFKENKELYNKAFELKKLGYKIGILSDQWYYSKEAFVNKKLTKKFDVAIFSCDVGIRKPNPKIYKLTLKKLKVKPKESLFIDNRDWNTKAAEKVGMKTIVFKNNKQLFKTQQWLRLFERAKSSRFKMPVWKKLFK